MSQKDYTDYNGEKRKFIQRPPRERTTYRSTTPRKHKRVGCKTLADRYKALDKILDYYNRFKDCRFSDWMKKRHAEVQVDTIKKKKAMKAHYISIGVWEKVKKYL